MTPIYLYLLLGSLSVPLLFSWLYIDLIKNWKNFIISTTVIAALFLIWDAFFTYFGIWGFNTSYCIGIYILKMPIEEWLFFCIIPFCSLFIHYALHFMNPKIELSKSLTLILTIALIGTSIALVAFNISKIYTSVNFTLLSVCLLIGLKFYINKLQKFFISFLIILIPFLLVNGVLTGSITTSPIVWYNESETLGFRVFTIPIEDFGYAFTMLFGNLLIFEHLNVKLD